ncbi:hypothetical protein AVEN_171928-1, partial [Araneus ventricosus]
YGHGGYAGAAGLGYAGIGGSDYGYGGVGAAGLGYGYGGVGVAGLGYGYGSVGGYGGLGYGGYGLGNGLLGGLGYARYDSLPGIFFHTELLTHTNKSSQHPEYLRQAALEVINNIPIEGILIYPDGSKNKIGHTGSEVFVKHGRGWIFS